jgi:hypothetical protein
MGLAADRPSNAAREVRPEALRVGVEVDHHLAMGHIRCPPQRVALALDGTRVRAQGGLLVNLGAECERDLGRAVRRVVEDEHLVDGTEIQQRHQSAEDRRYRGRLVARREADRDRGGSLCGQALRRIGTVVQAAQLRS